MATVPNKGVKTTFLIINKNGLGTSGVFEVEYHAQGKQPRMDLPYSWYLLKIRLPCDSTLVR